MEKYTVYILHSPAHDKYYVGQTSDIATRLLFHNELSENSYTSKYRPWKLVFQMEVPSRSLAMRIESYIKGRKSKAYLVKLCTEQSAVHKLKKRFDAAG